jgi:hypothetical protein
MRIARHPKKHHPPAEDAGEKRKGGASAPEAILFYFPRNLKIRH